MQRRHRLELLDDRLCLAAVTAAQGDLPLAVRWYEDGQFMPSLGNLDSSTPEIPGTCVDLAGHRMLLLRDSQNAQLENA